jgi:hypothetical protein
MFQIIFSKKSKRIQKRKRKKVNTMDFFLENVHITNKERIQMPGRLSHANEKKKSIKTKQGHKSLSHHINPAQRTEAFSKLTPDKQAPHTHRVDVSTITFWLSLPAHPF